MSLYTYFELPFIIYMIPIEHAMSIAVFPVPYFKLVSSHVKIFLKISHVDVVVPDSFHHYKIVF